jgi:hypothetical protein
LQELLALLLMGMVEVGVKVEEYDMDGLQLQI